MMKEYHVDDAISFGRSIVEEFAVKVGANLIGRSKMVTWNSLAPFSTLIYPLGQCSCIKVSCSRTLPSKWTSKLKKNTFTVAYSFSDLWLPSNKEKLRTPK